MTYDTSLERRIDSAIAEWDEVIPKKKMFGGIAYMLNGNMVFGVHKAELVVRSTETQGRELLKRDGVRRFQLGSKVSMGGWFLVDGGELAHDSDLASMLTMSRDHVLTLPPK